MDALRLEVGDHALEIGAGPGYVGLVLADRVGPTGVIYAVDRSAEAISHLERLQKERGITHIRRFVADAAAVEPANLHPDSALITMVLNHVRIQPAFSAPLLAWFARVP
jgi:precorrin-6B methylase 2